MDLFNIPKKWDAETDIIIIGSGNAGLPAAITATDKGAEVIILETGKVPASSLAYMGGGTLFVGTDQQKAAGIDDTIEECLKEAVECSGGNPVLWKALLDRNVEVYEWLKSLGAKPTGLFKPSGHGKTRCHRFEGHGPRLLKILRDTAEKKGIKIAFEHHAERLIVDPAEGRVIGVKVSHKGETLNFKARKAVIIATGGFCQNEEMIKEYGQHHMGIVPTGSPTHRGDGLKMALAIGAATEGIGIAVCPSTTVCASTGHITIMEHQGAIAVNMDGKRWADEIGTMYGILFGRLMNEHPDGLHILMYDEKIRKDASPEDYKRVKEYQADTVEELAKAVGIDPKALADTVKEYNADIDKNGYDTKFGKKHWGGLHGTDPPPKIDTPPYYAIKGKVSFTSCKGGLKVDAKSRVINQFGDVIPGLYAAGEVMGGFQNKPGAYYAAQLTSSSFIFGRIAGEDAASLDNA